MHRLIVILLACASLAGAVTPSMIWRDYYSFSSVGITGHALPVGSVVVAFDPEGIECGRDTVTMEGTYGYLHVYGDDPLTPSDEGAAAGDPIRFFVDGLEFYATPPVIWVAGDRSVNRADLFPDLTLLVTGSVRYGLATQNGVSGVALTLTGPTSGVLSTDAAGQFMFGPLVEGRYRLMLDMPDPGRFRSAITAYDASLILQHVLSGTEFPSPPLVADVSGDDEVSAFDAALLLQFVVGMREAFPRAQALWVDADSVDFDHALGDTSRVLFTVQAVGDVSGNWSGVHARPAGGRGTITVDRAETGAVYRLRSDQPVYALTLEIETRGKEPVVSLPEGWLVALHRDGGMVKLSAAGASPLPHDHALLTSDVPLAVKRGTLNEGERLAVPPARALPALNLAVRAAPNPFNPSTRIHVEAVEPGTVEVSIWSLAGQLVLRRTLEASAGAISLDWDGADLTGRQVASGLYLCRASQGRSTAQTRLLVVR